MLCRSGGGIGGRSFLRGSRRSRSCRSFLEQRCDVWDTLRELPNRRAQFIADLGRQRLWVHLLPDGGVRHGVEHGAPTLGSGIGRHGRAGGLGQASCQFGWKRRAGLGWTRRLTERTNRATIAEEAVQFAEPLAMLGFDPGTEPGLQLLGERSAFFVLRPVLGGNDNLADVAQVNIANTGEGGLGVVTPLCGTQTWEQTLTDGFEHLGRNLGLRAGSGEFVLPFDGGTQAGHTVSEHDPGKRTLHFRDLVERCIAVNTPCAKPLRLGLGCLLWTFPARAIVAPTSTTSATVVASAATLVAVPSIAATVAGATVVASTTSTAASALVATASTAIAAISTVVSTTLADQLSGDAALVPACAQDLEHLWHGTLRLRRLHANDCHAIDAELGIGTHDIANGCTLVQKRSVEVALGLFGSGGSPCVGTVFAFTGELYFEASRHTRHASRGSPGGPLWGVCERARGPDPNRGSSAGSG